MNTRRRGNARCTMNTIPELTLPRANHPIWTMGFQHVAIAHAVCAAIYQLGAPVRK